jgi:hypothetical protein
MAVFQMVDSTYHVDQRSLTECDVADGRMADVEMSSHFVAILDVMS